MAKTREQELREREERITRAAQNIAAGIGPIKLGKIENKDYKKEGPSSTVPLKKVDIADKNWAIKDQDSAFKRVASALAPKLSLDTKSKPTSAAQMDKLSLARAAKDFAKNQSQGMTTKAMIDQYSGNPYAGVEFTPAGERVLVDNAFGNYVTKPIMSGAYNTERNIAIGRSVNIGQPNNDSEAVRAYNQLLERYAPEQSNHAIGRAVQSAGQLVGQQLNYNANPLAGTPLRGVGTTAKMYESMVGDVYDSLASAGVSKERASEYAQTMGIVLAGLEKAQLDEVMKGFKVLNKAGGAGVIKDLSALSGMEKALGAKTTRMLVDTLAPATGRYLKGIAKETGEEVLQEAVQLAGENLAKHQEGIQKDSFGDIASRLKDTAVQSAGAFAVIGLPSLGTNMSRPDGGYNYTEQMKTGKADVIGALNSENQRLNKVSDMAMQMPNQEANVQNTGGYLGATDTRVHKDSNGFYLANENTPRTPINERQVVNLGKKLGVQIEFTDYDDSRIQGQWDGQKLYVSRTANRPLTTVLMHELTHSVENTNFYGDLANDIILNNYQDNWSEAVQRKQAQLEQAGQRFDVDYAQKEIIAEHFQDLFGNEEAVQALVRQNGNLGQRIYQWLGDLIQKIGSTDEAKLLIDARRQFGEALAYNKERRFANQEMQNLAQAQNMMDMDKNNTQQDYSRATENLLQKIKDARFNYVGIYGSDKIYQEGDYTPASLDFGTDELLNGTSSTGLGYLWNDLEQEDIETLQEAIDFHNDEYDGIYDYRYIIGGDRQEYGTDKNESVIKNAQVIARLFQDDNPNVQNMMDMDGERGKVSRLGQRTADSDMYNLIGDSLQDKIDMGQLDYTVIGDAPEVARAKARLERNSADKLAYEFITKSDSNERLTKSDAVTAIGAVQALINEGKLDLAEDMITSLSLSATEAGQFIQSLHLLTALTPEGKVKQANKMIAKLEKQRVGQKQFDAEFDGMDFVSKERREDILRQTTPEGAAQAQKRAVIEYVQNIDPTLWEKADAWRYLAMLGNPRTHMRNIAGNLLFKLPRGVGKGIAGATQDIIGNRNTDEFRTRTLKPSSTKQKQAAKAYFAVAQSLMDNAHPDRAAIELKQQNQKLLPGVLNSLANFNTNALEAEDVFFMKSEFVSTFANYLQANQIDPSTIADFGQNIDGKEVARPKASLDPKTEKIVQNGIDYAIQQAKEATFREYNSLARKLNKIKTGGGKAQRLAMDAVFPFTTTPLNIAKQGAVVYSPLGLAKGIHQLYNKAHGGDIKTSDVIDTFARGLSGTAIVGVGFALAEAGLLSGGDPEDRKEKALAGLEGEQVYAINLGDYTYTLDWMAPASMPLFLGVELYNEIQKDGGANWGNITDSLSTISDPMIQMSVLQGLNNFVSGFQQGGITDAIGNTLKELTVGYTGQYIPTLMGQVARTMDDTRRTKYWDKNSNLPEVAKSMINNAKAKTPVWAETAPAYIDSFGQTQSTGSSAMSRAIQNMLSPGFINKKLDDKSIEELRRLYDATAEKTVIPGASVRYLSVNGENVQFTPKQYEEWNTLNGKLRKEAVDGLFSSKSYQQADEATKVKMVEKVYKYATERAKEEMFQVPSDAWVNNIDKENVGGSIAQKIGENDFKERVTTAKKEGDSKFLLKNSPFEDLELTGKARTRYIYDQLNDTDKKKWDGRNLNMDIEDFYKAQLVASADADNPFEGLGLQGEKGWNFVLSTISDSAYARSRYVRSAWPDMSPDFYYEAYRAIHGEGKKEDKIPKLIAMGFPTSDAYRFWNYHNSSKYK